MENKISLKYSILPSSCYSSERDGENVDVNIAFFLPDIDNETVIFYLFNVFLSLYRSGCNPNTFNIVKIMSLEQKDLTQIAGAGPVTYM